jgi:tetratricopeptide (TPR) repeat protein
MNTQLYDNNTFAPLAWVNDINLCIPDVKTNLNNTRDLLLKKDYNQALILAKQVIDDVSNTFGLCHYYSIEAQMLLGTIYRIQNNQEGSISAFKIVAECTETNFGEDSIYYAYALANLGDVYKHFKDYKKALDCYDTATDIAADYDVDDDIQIGYLYASMAEAIILSRDEDFDDWKEYFEDALSIFTMVLGEHHDKVLELLDRIKIILMRSGELIEASHIHGRQADLITKRYGPASKTYQQIQFELDFFNRINNPDAV